MKCFSQNNRLPDDFLRAVPFTVHANSSWIACAASGVYQYITNALGFRYLRECAAYCFDNDLYSSLFADDASCNANNPRFAATKQLIINGDYRNVRVVQPLLPQITPEQSFAESAGSKNDFEYLERYRNFLTAAFIHLTTFDGWIKSPTVNYGKDGFYTREEFVNYWRVTVGLSPIDLKSPFTEEQLNETITGGHPASEPDYMYKNIAEMKAMGADIWFTPKIWNSLLQNIQNYLTEYRIRNSDLYGSGNDLIDAINFAKNYVVSKILTESNFGYLSGNDFNVEVGTPVAKVSAGVATGSFYVYHKSSPKVRYKVGCYGVTASVGVSANLPVNVNIGLESLPSAGKIFNGYFRSISNIEDFSGRYTVIGANAGVFANMTTALLFVGRNPLSSDLLKTLFENYSEQLLDYTVGGIPLAELFGARAIITLDGQGFQLLAGAGASIASGH